LHTYLSGLGIEIQASSDNVLRGGLTPKHVDSAELLRVLTFEPMVPPLVHPTKLSDVEEAFATPAADFRLSRIHLGGSVKLNPFGPELLLCSEGTCRISAKDSEPADLKQGDSVFVAASTKEVELEGQASLFRATVGAA
jgi:mannose-6-phosphate isomerase